MPVLLDPKILWNAERSTSRNAAYLRAGTGRNTDSPTSAVPAPPRPGRGAARLHRGVRRAAPGAARAGGLSRRHRHDRRSRLPPSATPRPRSSVRRAVRRLAQAHADPRSRRSFKYQRPVRELVGERAANTALLAIAALIVATLLGIPVRHLHRQPHAARSRGASRRVAAAALGAAADQLARAADDCGAHRVAARLRHGRPRRISSCRRSRWRCRSPRCSSGCSRSRSPTRSTARRPRRRAPAAFPRPASLAARAGGSRSGRSSRSTA